MAVVDRSDGLKAFCNGIFKVVFPLPTRWDDLVYSFEKTYFRQVDLCALDSG